MASSGALWVVGVRWDGRGAAGEEGCGGEAAAATAPTSGEEDEEWTNSSDLGAGFAALLASVGVAVLLGGFGLVLARRSRRTDGVGCVIFLSFCATGFGFSAASFVGFSGGVGALPAGLAS